MRFILFLLAFLLFGAFLIISNGNFHLKDQLERKEFLNSYYSWMDNIIHNVGTITGAIIHVDWVPPKNYAVNISK